MFRFLHKCPNCGKYTLNDKCDECGQATIVPCYKFGYKYMRNYSSQNKENKEGQKNGKSEH